MRIFNRSHVPWFLFVVLATLAAGWIYVGNFYPARLAHKWALPAALVQQVAEGRKVGSTPLGLIFGSLSFAIFIFGVLLSLRKKLVLWPIGSVQSWLRAHIWLTLLTIPLVLLHSGFRLGSAMTTLLMAIYAIVMVSGIYGLFLQHVMPRIMNERLPAETVYEQIPYIRSQLYRAAEKMRDSLQHHVAVAPAISPLMSESNPAGQAAVAYSESEAALVTFLEEQVMPYLDTRLISRSRLSDRHYSEDAFRFVALSVAEPYRAQVQEIQGWCDERRALDLQLRLHHWLHGWLFVHVPFSFLLLLLTAWHAVIALFYY